MTQYPKNLKESIIAKLLPPNNASVPEIAKETGIPKGTLYSWQHKARGKSNSTSKFKLNSEEKFAIVLETASLNELELGEYCRQKGLYPEQIDTWKKAFIKGACTTVSKPEREELQQQSRTIRKLQSELHRKDKALAEAAALLVLEKKFQALWTEQEDEKSTCRSAKK